MNEHYTFWKMTAGVLCTVGLYSVLYRENKFYRFFEHIFLGLAAGYAIVALWTENLKEGWYDLLVGSQGTAGHSGPNGYYLYALLLPIGLMGYFVFSKKHSWMSRIPIGIVLGLWSGQQVQVWWNRYGGQIQDSIKPMVPTVWSPAFKPDAAGMDPKLAANVANNVYISDAVTNIIFVITLLAVLSYFLFSFDVKNKAIRGFSTLGRYLLMIGFGAIFGSTVMMRFSLVIDRMYYIWIEWLMNHVMHGKF
ncbi:MAG TPA: hypothetical protein VGL56_11155 [Fimbriimonadaceae bacterium]|jgi:hypothetical protein